MSELRTIARACGPPQVVRGARRGVGVRGHPPSSATRSLPWAATQQAGFTSNKPLYRSITDHTSVLLSLSAPPPRRGLQEASEEHPWLHWPHELVDFDEGEFEQVHAAQTIACSLDCSLDT